MRFTLLGILMIATLGCSKDQQNLRSDVQQKKEPTGSFSQDDLLSSMTPSPRGMPNDKQVKEFSLAMGTQAGDENFNPAYDFNKDNKIDVEDYRIFKTAALRQLEGADLAAWRAFIFVDTAEDASISVEEMITGIITAMSTTVDSPDRNRLDFTGDGSIDHKDFASLITVRDSQLSNDYRSNVLGAVHTYSPTKVGLTTLQSGTRWILEIILANSTGSLFSSNQQFMLDWNLDGVVDMKDADLAIFGMKYWSLEWKDTEFNVQHEAYSTALSRFSDLKNIRGEIAAALVDETEIGFADGKISQAKLTAMVTVVELILTFKQDELDIYRAIVAMPVSDFDSAVEQGQELNQ